MNSLKVGNIIKVSDSANPDTVGVIIDVNKNNLICFNIDQNKNPIFYKVDLDHVVFSLENGSINSPNFMDIKKAILQYYHSHKDNKDEIKVLKKIIDFAYPNGIPELTDKSNHIPIIETENSKLLETGTQIKLKCYPNSSISFLDNQVVDVLDFFDKGIRTLKRGSTPESNKYYSLFYRDPINDKTLAGVKEIIILTKKAPVSLSILEQLKIKLKNDTEKASGFISQIMDPRGDIYELNSSTLEVKALDQKKSGVYFPGTDEINISSFNLPNLDNDIYGESDGESDGERIFIDDEDNFSVSSRSESPVVTILPVSGELNSQFFSDDENDDVLSSRLPEKGMSCGSPSTVPLDLNLKLDEELEPEELEEINLSQIGGVKQNSVKNIKTSSKTSHFSTRFTTVIDSTINI
jgi:hypothetical protein